MTDHQSLEQSLIQQSRDDAREALSSQDIADFNRQLLAVETNKLGSVCSVCNGHMEGLAKVTPMGLICAICADDHYHVIPARLTAGGLLLPQCLVPRSLTSYWFQIVSGTGSELCPSSFSGGGSR